MSLKDFDIEKIKDIAKLAGDAIMDIYKEDYDIEYKKDNSPLTNADKISNEIICENLKKIYPNVSIMSEENKEVPYEKRRKWKYYWCIDPIDGTKEFIKKNDEFTVNIALIHKNKPVLGVVFAPALKDMYWAKEGNGAYKNNKKLPLHFNNTPEHSLTIVASRSHISVQTQEFIDKLQTKNINQISKGSSLKLCMVAEGLADIYPRLAPTMEWDTAAADAVVRESGKMAYEFKSGVSLRYNKENLQNPYFIVSNEHNRKSK